MHAPTWPFGLVCWCFCHRFVALSLLLFFFCPSCHMRPSIDSWPASSHTLPPMNRRYAPPLQRSGVTLLRPPGASAPDFRESRGTSAPAVASAGVRDRLRSGPQRARKSSLAPTQAFHARCVEILPSLTEDGSLSSLALRAADLRRRELLFSACLHGACSCLFSFLGQCCDQERVFFLKAPRSIVFETFDWMHGVSMQHCANQHQQCEHAG